MKDIYLRYLLQFVGTPYQWGGTHPKVGLDCSEFAQEALSCLGLDFKGDQTAEELHDNLIMYSTKAIVPSLGYLLFFGWSKITHVAIALNSKYMIEAGGGGSKDLHPSTSSGAFVRIRPINSRSDLLTILKPNGLDSAFGCE